MNKKGFATIGLAITLFLSMPLIGPTIIAIQTADQIYAEIEQVPQKEVGLVLGAAVYGERLSDILKDRVDTGIDLYKERKISLIVMSGSANEAKAMKIHAQNNGIPEDSIIEDATGLNTMASVKNIAELNRSVVIVSQAYHLPRALFIANTLGLDAVGHSSDRREYLKIYQFKKRELLATTKAILDIYILK